jgi:hypothetical protein
MASDMKTKLSTILLAIRQQLIDQNTFLPENVYLSLRMNPPFHVQAEQYCVITPVTQTFDEAFWEGGSRYDTLVRGRVQIYVRNRFAADQVYQDSAWLTDATSGALDKLHSVMNALVSFQAPDISDNVQLEEPMRPVFCMEPRKDLDNPEWGQAMVEFEIVYRLSLTIAPGVLE